MSYFSRFNSNNKGIPFMDGATKGDVNALMGRIVHIRDFGFIHGEDGDYSVFCVDETPGLFYFGNAILTDTLKQIEADGQKANIPAVGIAFKSCQSKKGRTYVGFDFVDPEDVVINV